MKYDVLLGLFALFTVAVASAAVGRLIGLRPADSIYLILLILSFLGWWIGRRKFVS